MDRVATSRECLAWNVKQGNFQTKRTYLAAQAVPRVPTQKMARLLAAIASLAPTFQVQKHLPARFAVLENISLPVKI